MSASKPSKKVVTSEAGSTGKKKKKLSIFPPAVYLHDNGMDGHRDQYVSGVHSLLSAIS
jgi:hypothetical protein